MHANPMYDACAMTHMQLPEPGSFTSILLLADVTLAIFIFWWFSRDDEDPKGPGSVAMLKGS